MVIGHGLSHFGCRFFSITYEALTFSTFTASSEKLSVPFSCTVSSSLSFSWSLQFGVVEHNAAALVIQCFVLPQCLFHAFTLIQSRWIQNNRHFIEGMEEGILVAIIE